MTLRKKLSLKYIERTIIFSLQSQYNCHNLFFVWLLYNAFMSFRPKPRDFGAKWRNLKKFNTLITKMRTKNNRQPKQSYFTMIYPFFRKKIPVFLSKNQILLYS